MKTNPITELWRALKQRLALPAGDLLHDASYRRLFGSILLSSIGGQVSMLALPLTAAVLLHATPTQMGWLTALEILPFVLFSLPAGVWLDRVRKLPVYVAGEAMMACVLASVPLAWWLGWLGMSWMYTVGFVLGSVSAVAGSASQIVLTQVVPRERLVEAHAKNALASSSAEVLGPGLAGALVKAVGAPVALLVDAFMLAASVLVLRGIEAGESLHARARQHFLHEMGAGLRFVRDTPLLVALALLSGVWQMCHHAAVVVQILFATRTLGLSEQDVGLCFVGLGAGTVTASALGSRISARLGVGPCLLLGLALTGVGWTTCSLAPTGPLGVALFVFMLVCFGSGAVLIFINFLALRQAVTPAPLLGRMTSTMRWLALLPAGPGALMGGWLGEHVGLRAALAFAGGATLLMATAAWRHPLIRGVRHLPTPTDHGPEPAPGAPGVAAQAASQAR